METHSGMVREAALRAAVLVGDQDAWRAWYDETFDSLYAYVLWRCVGRVDAAEDVVQQTWMTAVRRIADFDPQAGTFAHWIRGIAANVLRNDQRRRFRDGVRQDCPQQPAATDNNQNVALHVAETLAALPAQFEEVLRAKYFERQSVEEIALARGQSAKAVESLLTRARQAFKNAFTNGD